MNNVTHATTYKQIYKFCSTKVIKLLSYSIILGLALGLTEIAFGLFLGSFLSQYGLTNTSREDYFFKLLDLNENAPALLVIMCVFTRFFLVVGSGVLVNATNEVACKDLRDKFANLALNDTCIKSGLNSGEASAFLTNIVPRYASFWGSLGQLFNQLFISAIAFYGLLSASWTLALAIFGVLLLIYWPTQKIRKSYLPYSSLYYKQADDFVKYLIRSIKNAYFLKIVGKNRLELDKLHDRTSQLKKNLLAYQFRFQLSGALPTLMGAIIFVGVVMFASNFTNMKQGELLFFLYVFYRLSGSIGGVVSAIGMVEFNFPYACRATSLLCEGEKDNVVNIPNLDGDTKKEMNYDLVVKGNPFLIDYIKPIKVNFEAKQGDFVLINGPSGRGKSTFLLALIGLVTPIEGRITWGDICVKDLHRQNFLNKVGYSGAEPFLLDTSIRENLLYGNTEPNNVSDDAINKALDIAQCLFLLDSKGEKYLIDEKISADSILSSGERQRISIARAILREPKIFLFDEATANIDEITEEKIYKGLKINYPRSIILAVSHKSSTINMANIFVEFK